MALHGPPQPTLHWILHGALPAALPLTFKDHLDVVLSRELVIAHKALVGAPIALHHVIHDKVCVVQPCDPHVFPRLEDFAISVPGEFLILISCHTAGQGDLAAHAAFNLSGTDGGFQWLWVLDKREKEVKHHWVWVLLK